MMLTIYSFSFSTSLSTAPCPSGAASRLSSPDSKRILSPPKSGPERKRHLQIYPSPSRKCVNKIDMSLGASLKSLNVINVLLLHYLIKDYFFPLGTSGVYSWQEKARLPALWWYLHTVKLLPSPEGSTQAVCVMYADLLITCS